ncbi:MAG: hypothetical protein KAJ28_05745 [Flavobacteriaceae bacterium]|nr:hypothetical protein [Flavobacteriaceae bacterium]
MKTLKALLLYASLFGIIGCSGGGVNDDPPPPEVDPPSASALEFPLQNSECTEGTNFTTTQSTITFNWGNSNNTDSYQLVLKNLETGEISNHNSSVSQVDITVLRGTPYSWYVISKSNSTTQTAQSTIWKFYNAGVAVTSYAPFPAELIAPTMGTSLNTITSTILEWSGSDVDNDIAEYEVLFGIDNPPANSGGTSSSSSMTVTVAAGNTYYWRVITKDDQNNTSNSEIFQFKVN